MYIYGEFVNKGGALVRVEIETGGDRREQVEIGAEGSGVWFGDDPVEVSQEVNDTFDVLLERSASVRLLTDNYRSELFNKSARDARVWIKREGVCVFAGYVEPMTYSQPYNEVWDELEINCIDSLSALQYTNYKNAGAAGVDYDKLKEEAQTRTFGDIIRECLDNVCVGSSYKLWYDGSKAAGETAAAKDLFGKIKVSDLLFLDDSEDKVWTQQEVVEEVLRYLNLHIVSYGEDYYVFDWGSLRAGKGIEWTDVIGGGTTKAEAESITISQDNVADTGTKISVGEVWNQIALTCTVKKQGDAVENPLDEDGLINVYTARQKYMTEIMSDGEGEKAYRAFINMIKGEETDYKNAKTRDWWIRVKRHIRWTFPINGDESKDVVRAMCGSGETKKPQQNMPNYLSRHVAAGLMAIGKVEKKADQSDNSVVNKIDMTNYMVIGVNGNGEADPDNGKPSETDLQGVIPVALYRGAVAGGAFSPTDEQTTNYFLISGSLVLNPLMPMTDSWTYIKANPDAKRMEATSSGYETVKKWFGKTVKSNTHHDGRYYTREYWKADTPQEEAVPDGSLEDGLIPFTGEVDAQYEYKYSAIGDKTDTVSKVGVLQCMLVVGDKCVVEKGTEDKADYPEYPDYVGDLGTGVAYTGQGLPGDFVWKKFKPLDECKSIDEYLRQSFTIGFDPKIGDKLIGTEYELQNNVDYTLGLEDAGSGIAIPIRKSDKVSGRVVFRILGPVNLIWDEITRRHPTCFRHTKWSSKGVDLLAKVSDIWIKKLEIKVVSDNGGYEVGDDEKDLVYMSDTDEAYLNKKDDIEFKIQTGLTAAEAAKLSVKNDVKISNALDEEGDVLMSLYDTLTGESGKAEQMYVDAYWREYHAPKVEMEQNLRADAKPWALYRSEAMGKMFYVEGMGWNGGDDEWAMKLKEV